MPTTIDTTGSRWSSSRVSDAAGQTVADDADSRQRLRPIGTSMTLAPSAHRPYALGRSVQAITPTSPESVTTGFSRMAVADRTPVIARSSAKSVSGTDGVCSSKTVVTVPASVEPIGAGPRLATIVVITPTATLVTKSASMMPLIARKPAFGLSARRRAAMSVAGRLAYRAITRAPTIVSHGPAKTRPAMMSSRPGRNTAAWPSDVSGLKPMAKNSTATPSRSGINRYARGGAGGDPPGDAQRRDPYPAQRDLGRHRRAGRDAERHQQDVQHAQGHVAGEERHAGERDARERVAEGVEQADCAGPRVARGRPPADRRGSSPVDPSSATVVPSTTSSTAAPGADDGRDPAGSRQDRAVRGRARPGQHDAVDRGRVERGRLAGREVGRDQDAVARQHCLGRADELTQDLVGDGSDVGRAGAQVRVVEGGQRRLGSPWPPPRTPLPPTRPDVDLAPGLVEHLRDRQEQEQVRVEDRRVLGRHVRAVRSRSAWTVVRTCATRVGRACVARCRVVGWRVRDDEGRCRAPAEPGRSRSRAMRQRRPPVRARRGGGAAAAPASVRPAPGDWLVERSARPGRAPDRLRPGRRGRSRVTSTR